VVKNSASSGMSERSERDSHFTACFDRRRSEPAAGGEEGETSEHMDVFDFEAESVAGAAAPAVDQCGCSPANPKRLCVAFFGAKKSRIWVAGRQETPERHRKLFARACRVRSRFRDWNGHKKRKKRKSRNLEPNLTCTYHTCWCDECTLRADFVGVGRDKVALLRRRVGAGSGGAQRENL